MKIKKEKPHKLCLVCSSGGHLFQLTCLEPFWSDKKHFWVCFPTRDAKYLLEKEDVYWAHYPTNRNMKNFVRNLFLAFKILRNEKPTVIISTGAGVAVPFILLGKVFGAKAVYVESITRSEGLSLSGKLVYPFVDKFLVQWPDLADELEKAEYRGQVI